MTLSICIVSLLLLGEISCNPVGISQDGGVNRYLREKELLPAMIKAAQFAKKYKEHEDKIWEEGRKQNSNLTKLPVRFETLEKGVQKGAATSLDEMFDFSMSRRITYKPEKHGPLDLENLVDTNPAKLPRFDLSEEISSVASAAVVPTAKPSSAVVPTTKPSSAVVPTAKPSAAVVPTAKPSAAVVPTAKPSAAVVTTAKLSAAVVPTAKPSAAVVPTAKLSAAAVPGSLQSSVPRAGNKDLPKSLAVNIQVDTPNVSIGRVNGGSPFQPGVPVTNIVFSPQSFNAPQFNSLVQPFAQQFPHSFNPAVPQFG